MPVPHYIGHHQINRAAQHRFESIAELEVASQPQAKVVAIWELNEEIDVRTVRIELAGCCGPEQVEPYNAVFLAETTNLLNVP